VYIQNSNRVKTDPMAWRAILGLLVLTELILEANASIHKYENDRFSSQRNSFFFMVGARGFMPL
jgi:hypothetical protein